MISLPRDGPGSIAFSEVSSPRPKAPKRAPRRRLDLRIVFRGGESAAGGSLKTD